MCHVKPWQRSSGQSVGLGAWRLVRIPGRWGHPRPLMVGNPASPDWASRPENNSREFMLLWLAYLFSSCCLFFFGLYFNDVFLLLIIYSHTHSVCHWRVGIIGSFWLTLLIVSGCAAGRWAYLYFVAFPEAVLEELEETRHLGSLCLVAFFIRYVKQLIGTCLFLGSRESGMDVQQLRWTCAFWRSVGDLLC